MRFIIRRTVPASGHAGDCEFGGWLAENLQKNGVFNLSVALQIRKENFFHDVVKKQSSI
jgi:hypothetical protein